MRCMRINFAISFLIASAALAQSVKVGVIGGVPLTDPVRFNDESKRYLVGPSVEVRFLDGRPGVEMNALYRRTGTAFSFAFSPNPDYPQVPERFSSRTVGNTWEFPLLGKYYFRTSDEKWRPFLGTGYTIRHTWTTTTDESVFSGNPTPQVSKRGGGAGVDVGATVVGGIDWKWTRRISVQPQFRYTRYGDRSDTLNRGQVDFMLGIRF